jgi:hypothetical protein
MRNQQEKGFIEILVLVLVIAACATILRECSAFKPDAQLDRDRIVRLHNQHDLSKCRDEVYEASKYHQVECDHAYHDLTHEVIGDVAWFKCVCNPEKVIMTPDLQPIPPVPDGGWYQ